MVYMYHSFLIHSSADGHLGCFHALAMTNLDSTLKSKDITLLTKVCIVKAMVFPVVMYGCETWTLKKAEHPIPEK